MKTAASSSDTHLDELASAAKARPAPIRQWMVQNYADLRAKLANEKRINWREFSKKFRQSGILDADGNPPSDETIKRAYYSVHCGLRAQKRKAQEKLAAPASVKPAVPVVQTPTDYDEPKPSFRGIGGKP